MWCAYAIDKGPFVTNGVKPLVFEVSIECLEQHFVSLKDRLDRLVHTGKIYGYFGPLYSASQDKARGELDKEIEYEFM